MFQPRLPRALGEQVPVGEADQLAGKLAARDGEAKLRPDAGRLAGSERYARAAVQLRVCFHVGLVAQAAQPQLGLFVGLTGADGLDGLAALQLVGVVELAAAQASGQCASRTGYGRAR